jgi:hypothetical protein
VNSESVAPMLKSAMPRPRPTERARPVGDRKGHERQRGAGAKGDERARGGADGRAELAGLSPSSSRARVSSAVLGIGDELLARARRFLLRQALGGVDQRELLRLGLRILLELVALERDLVLEELALRADDTYSPAAIAKAPGRQSRDARESTSAASRSRPRRRGSGSRWRRARR